MIDRRALVRLAAAGALAFAVTSLRASAQAPDEPAPIEPSAPPIAANPAPLVAAPPPAPPSSAAPPTGEAPAVPAVQAQDDMVQLDFNDVELNVVIDTIARLTGKNFIYDDRVRGRVTIVSPTKIPVDQAYAVFESVLQVKGFTTIDGPGGAIKIIPVRDAKESPVDTLMGKERTPNRDSYVTRLIPLRYIDADAIGNSLKPLVSKDAALVAYPPTNTIILTDAATNIRRILSILEAIDIETYREELAVLKVVHADAATVAQQLGDIYGADVTTAGDQGGTLRPGRVRPQIPGQPQTPQTGLGGEVRRDRVRLITDARTNSIIVLASRARLDDIRRLVAKLDVPVTGGGRVHVYYLKNADAEDLSETLNALISGQPKASRTATGAPPGAALGGTPAAQAQALKAVVTELAEGVTITADKGTNALVIQASQEGFRTLSQVIEALDIQRPQVLVEALIMEVDVNNAEDLGFNGIGRVINGATDITIGSLTDTTTAKAVLLGTATGGAGASGALSGLLANAVRNTITFDDKGNPTSNGSLIQGIIKASASDGNTNILSAPHILTSDNEKAEIKIGDNIPLPSSRVQSAAGITTTPGNESQLATSVNIERKDIGITLNVEPQITEGESLRLKILQEITDVNRALTVQSGFDPNQVGVALSNRKIENVVVVADGETVVIGGLVSDASQDTVSKVPWLGEIPFLGWLFKTTSTSLVKKNLLVFLTPHIIRTAEDLEAQTIRKREEFRRRTVEGIPLSDDQRLAEEERRQEAEAYGIPYEPLEAGPPARREIQVQERRYPLQRMREIEESEKKRKAQQAAAQTAAQHGPRYGVLAASFRSESAARAKLTELVDAGYDGTLVTTTSGGAVIYEIRLGPFETQDEAERMAETVRRAYGFAPSVVLEREHETP